MKLSKKDIKKIEGLGWSVEVTDYGYCLENFSPAGGDMVVEAKNKEDIISYCENFDEEEEFKVWYGANNGEPSNPGDLWEDCKAMREIYEELKDALTN